MIFSCTKKVQDRLKKYKEVEGVKEDTGLYNWYIDQVNLERKNHFLFTHSETLFSFLIYAGTKKELQNIEEIFTNKLKEQIIREIGTLDKYIHNAFPDKLEFRFIKTNSRSVLGSMNDFKHMVRTHIHYGDNFDVINHRINKIPMGMLKYDYPVRRMKSALEAIGN